MVKWITRESSLAQIDFGLLKATKGEKISQTFEKEHVWVLLQGKVETSWRGQKKVFERNSLFDVNPTVFRCPLKYEFNCTVLSETAEWAIACATNIQKFEPELFLPDDTKTEERGKDLVQGTCSRIVRTVFDYSTRPASQLVVGEVINLQGRWSSYPPHHHVQPEIYHYRFTKPQGYGHAEIGEKVVKVNNESTTVIPGGLDHAQVSAPGYGMYYLWIVRHLPDKPYTGFEFTEEHRWILEAKS